MRRRVSRPDLTVIFESAIRNMTVLLVILIVVVQLVYHIPWIGTWISNARNIKGRPITNYEILYTQGWISLKPSRKLEADDKGIILVNGVPYCSIDSIPDKISVKNGDVLEIQNQTMGSVLFFHIAQKSSNINSTALENTISAGFGITKVGKIYIK